MIGFSSDRAYVTLELWLATLPRMCCLRMLVTFYSMAHRVRHGISPYPTWLLDAQPWLRYRIWLHVEYELIYGSSSRRPPLTSTCCLTAEPLLLYYACCSTTLSLPLRFLVLGLLHSLTLLSWLNIGFGRLSILATSCHFLFYGNIW